MRAGVWVCPECEQGKHRNCNGSAWDFDADELVPCGCPDETHLAERQVIRRKVSTVLAAGALWLGVTSIGVVSNGYVTAAAIMAGVALLMFVGCVLTEETVR